MEINFEELMTKKSEEGLNEYLTNTDRYVSQAIYAAIYELKKRGRIFSADELQMIEARIQRKIEAEKKESEAPRSKPWDKNKVTDLSAAQFYTQRAIWGFSVFFTVIFGAVLLSSNISDKKGKWTVIGFGVLFTIIAVCVLNLLPRNAGLTLGVNGAGSYILTSLFWNRYIDPKTQYRAKPIWKPLIISISITIPIVLAMIYGEQ